MTVWFDAMGTLWNAISSDPTSRTSFRSASPVGRLALAERFETILKPRANSHGGFRPADSAKARE